MYYGLAATIVFNRMLVLVELNDYRHTINYLIILQY